MFFKCDKFDEMMYFLSSCGIYIRDISIYNEKATIIIEYNYDEWRMLSENNGFKINDPYDFISTAFLSNDFFIKSRDMVFQSSSFMREIIDVGLDAHDVCFKMVKDIKADHNEEQFKTEIEKALGAMKNKIINSAYGSTFDVKQVCDGLDIDYDKLIKCNKSLADMVEKEIKKPEEKTKDAQEFANLDFK